jgi:murein DD-endopeptidase MepM/ murein hydrolase activator NlpD
VFTSASKNLEGKGLRWPVVGYTTGEFYRFGAWVRSRGGFIVHLGDDVAVAAGTAVIAIAAGRVVQAEVRPGSIKKRNWGGIILIEHEIVEGEKWYSLYGHVGKIGVQTGSKVEGGQRLAEVARGLTPENGGWKEAHLHFGIYVGRWQPGQVLPGYKRWWSLRTRRRDWRDPQEFIANYPAA